MKVSYILNHRGKNGSRLNNLISVLGWLSPLKNVNIILVEQDDKPYLADLNLSYPGMEYVFAYNSGLFNRAWGFNIGFKYATGNVLAFSDNDIFMNMDELTNSFQECHRSYDAVNPYAKIVDLSEKDTKCLQENSELMKSCSESYCNGEERGYTVFCGGLVLLKRKAFEMLGGFDERFSGWGGEDDAMSILLRELVHSKCEMPHMAYHLWHERTIQDTNEQPNYPQNRRLLDEYTTLTRDELILLCKNSKKSKGNIERYRTITKELHELTNDPQNSLPEPSKRAVK